MAAETVDLGYVKGPTGDTGPVGPTGPQGDPATVPTTDLENFQGYIGYNEVYSSTATGNEFAPLSQIKNMFDSIKASISHRTSLIYTNIGVQSVSLDRTPQTVESSSLSHRVVYLDINDSTNAFINILGSIRFSSATPMYYQYIGAQIVLDVNDSDGDRLDLRCAGIVSAFTDTGVCAYTGTYYSYASTKTLYCAMSAVDTRDPQPIKSLVFY